MGDWEVGGVRPFAANKNADNKNADPIKEVGVLLLCNEWTIGRRRLLRRLRRRLLRQ